MDNHISLEQLASYAGSMTEADLGQLKPGRIDITIHADGQWSYRGSAFQRRAMVELLVQSLVIKDQAYYLVAPEQLLKIRVEDLPFRVVDIQVDEIQTDDKNTERVDVDNVKDTNVKDANVKDAAHAKNHPTGQAINLITDFGHTIRLDKQNTFQLTPLPNSDVIVPAIHVARGLYARLSRPCFYQLVALSEPARVDGREVMRIFSGGASHILGFLD